MSSERAPSIHVAQIKNTFIEIYNAFLKTTKQHLTKMEMVNVMIDAWSDTVSKRKFVGIRVSGTTAEYEFMSFLISCRELTMTSEQSRTKMWGVVLENHINTVIKSFNISPEQIVSATSDAGSDIRKIFKTKYGAMWEWCVSHMLHCVAKDTKRCLRCIP